MTPEQLEEVPGIGPKTVEKISIAVNNYFSSLEAAAAEEPVSPDAPTPGEGLPGSEETPLPEEKAGEGGGDESPTGPESAGQSGDVSELPADEEAADDSVADLVETGQYFESEVLDGVENAPPADEAEVTTHERESTEAELSNQNVPEEEKPGEQK